jgi:uncharacterized membrane protein YhaH (DUF805 family)
MDFLRAYFSFYGRLDRIEYLFVILTGNVLPGIFEFALETYMRDERWGDPNLIILPMAIFHFWITLAVLAKRFHDINKDGAWCLLIFVPLVNFLTAIGLFFYPSSEGKNRFGEPKRFIL